MGLKSKSQEHKRASEVKEKLADVVGKVGEVSVKYAVDSIEEGEEAILSAAQQLKVEGVITIEKRFLKKHIFKSKKDVIPTGNIDDLIDLLEERKSISVSKAAAILMVPKSMILKWAEKLEKDGLAHPTKKFMRERIINAVKVEILKYRINQRVGLMRRSKRIIMTDADILLQLCEKMKSVTMPEAVRALKIPEGKVEEIVQRLEPVLAMTYPANPTSSPMIKLNQVVEHPTDEKIEGEVKATYHINADNVPAIIKIIAREEDSMPAYTIEKPYVGEATSMLLKSFTNEISGVIEITADDITDPKNMLNLKDRFHDAATQILRAHVNISDEDVRILAGMMLHDMFGLGEMEILMHDDWLEEVCVNTSHIPITAYHKKFGWVKTNLHLDNERRIYNYAAQIGRKSEQDITGLKPIMDAHLLEGDRVNATLFPISNFGNTITIRKFSRRPWTIVDFMGGDLKELNSEMAAFLWMCLQYELNVIVGGGTASGKTSMLNCICSMIQPTQRVITIEDTREINLPKYLRWNWVPLTTRGANPEGKGEVNMLDLIVTSLRMRPDRIVLGEIRRRKEAEVLFEAMHTGHAVYATIHADTAENLKRRLLEPPIEIPSAEVEALQLMVIVYRDRRLGTRKVFEIAEVIPAGSNEEFELNYLWRWDARSHTFIKVNESRRVLEDLGLHTGLSREDIEKDLEGKKAILEWMLKENIRDLDDVGNVMDDYYKDPEKVLKKIGQPPQPPTRPQQIEETQTQPKPQQTPTEKTRDEIFSEMMKNTKDK